MRYLGGKSRVAKQLVEVINITDGAYWEPFVGGFCSFDIIAPKFKIAHANDIHPDLMLMWDAVLHHRWEPPTSVTRSEYQHLKHADPSALRGFVGFGCSFGGRWFGGYGRNTAGDDTTGLAAESARSVRRSYHRLKDTTVHIHNLSYDQLTPQPGDVVYCDPPYADTTTYSRTPAFNHDHFWNVVRKWSKEGVKVYVSEYHAPSDYVSIWSAPKRVDVASGHQRFDNVEHLFIWNG